MSGSAVNVPGANPAGSNTYLQFNNAGVFGGTAGATTDGTNITSLSLKTPVLMLGSTSGTLTWSVPAAVTSHTLILPAAIGSANQALTISNAGTGQLAWSDIALTGITSSLNTASPNNTINASRIIASGGSTNQDLVLSPKGTGAILAHLPNSTSTGGNKRGTYSVDLQLARSAAAQVASGSYAFAAGQNNTASATGTVAMGYGNTASTGGYGAAIGYENTATGSTAIAMGESNVASGDKSVALGYQATSSGANSFCVGLGSGTAAAAQSWSISNGGVTDVRHQGVMGCSGIAQSNVYTLHQETTDATPATLHPNGTAGTEYLTVRTNKLYAFTALIAGRNVNDGGGCGYELKGVIDNSADTVALVGTITKTVLGETTGAYDCDVTADDTNNCLVITVTGLAAKTVRWGATVIAVAVG